MFQIAFYSIPGPILENFPFLIQDLYNGDFRTAGVQIANGCSYFTTTEHRKY